MAGESILIVDDNPINLKLAKLVIADQGYTVFSATSAEEALGLLEKCRPDVILADIQLPGMDGLEFTRRVKADPATSSIPVIAVTAYAMDVDKTRGSAAGCDWYITKPLDTRKLASQIREALSSRKATPAASHEPKPIVDEAEKDDGFEPGLVLTASELSRMQHRFLADAVAQCRALVSVSEADFDRQEAARYLHQVVGSAGVLGYPEMAILARRGEAVLREEPLDWSKFREILSDLLLDAAEQFDSKTVRPPEHIARALEGKRIALVGFRDEYANWVCDALQRCGALPQLFPSGEPPTSDVIQLCTGAVIHVHPETRSTRWLDGPSDIPGALTVILTGRQEELIDLDPELQARASDIVDEESDIRELVVRVGLALFRRSASRTLGPQESPLPAPNLGCRKKSRPEIVVADDDALVVSAVQIVLENYGMACSRATNGVDALNLIQKTAPAAAVLDINMPGLDGYEILAAVRQANLAVPIILLTARQREQDVLRAFQLGADDYISKPFNTLELVARLRRLLKI